MDSERHCDACDVPQSSVPLCCVDRDSAALVATLVSTADDPERVSSKCPPSWSLSEFLITVGASDLESDTKATCNCYIDLGQICSSTSRGLGCDLGVSTPENMTLGPIQRLFTIGEQTHEPRHQHARPCLPLLSTLVLVSRARCLVSRSV